MSQPINLEVVFGLK